jgi:hypothetical protein
MSLNNDQENNSFDEGFSEETENFDQVVSTSETAKASSSRGWLILLVGIIGTGAYVGYRYYLMPSPPSTVPVVLDDKMARQAQKNAHFEHLKTHLFNQQEAEAEISSIPVPPPAPVAAVVTAPAVALQPKPMNPVNTIISEKPPAETTTAAIQTTQLNERLEANIHQIQHLEAALQGIIQTISKLSGEINALDNRLLALSNSTGNLSSDMGTMKTEISGVKRVLGEEGIIEPNAPPPPPSHTYRKVSQLASTSPKTTVPAYVVHAVIPGRAWLKSRNGQIMTVTEGDTLGDYGKVLVIDAASGMVLTSSGNTFQ